MFVGSAEAKSAAIAAGTATRFWIVEYKSKTKEPFNRAIIKDGLDVCAAKKVRK